MTARLAKLSRPRLYRILDRERLFTLLDASREPGAVWISGPPGSGKTALAASFLKARRLTAVWFEVDPGDSDPASFFHYLSLAAPTARRRRSDPLLSFTPECVDLASFARRFFRAFYARLPANAAVVFDNCHVVRTDAALPDILAIALSELPHGLRLILISRQEPPAALARAQAHASLARIGWDELRLTDDELREVALATREIDAATLLALRRRSGGWAVGLVLMLEQIRSSPSSHALLSSDLPQGSIDYFAGQVLDQVPAPTRELLVRTAFLPRVTEKSASALTGNGAAGELLEDLFRQRLFTDRHTGTEVSFQYHALFREYLRKHASMTLTAVQLQSLRATCAKWLEDEREFSAAFELRVENQDWEDATRLILRQARSLVADGRWLTLQSMIARLPADQTEQSPWLTLWLGSAIVLVNPTGARQTLSRTFESFLRTGDRRGCLMAATGVAETHNIEQTGIADLDRWIHVLEQGLATGIPYPTPAERTRVHTAFLTAAVLRQPAHPALAACLQDVEGALEQDLPLTAKADTATQLLAYFLFTGQLQRARSLIDRVGPIFEESGLTAFRRAGWLVFSSYYAALAGTYAQGFQALDRLRLIVREFGMKWFRFYDAFFRVLLHLMGPAPSVATALMEELRSRVDSSRPAEIAQAHLAQVLLYQARGEPSLAIYHAGLCLDAARQSGCPYFCTLFSTVIASAYVEAQRFEDAGRLLQEARAFSARTVLMPHEPLMLLSEAYLLLSRGDTARAGPMLALALRRGKIEQTASMFRWLVVGFRRMLAVALRERIEVDCARGFIAEFGILPESSDVENWPWPVSIRTLGGFELRLREIMAPATGKAQKKPLEMLKALAAQTGGEISATSLAEILWPDADGDAAMDAFEITLRRLRKLLADDSAVRLHEGLVSLNETICWTDTLAFERAHQRAEGLLAERAVPVAEHDLESVTQRLLGLYCGHFLQNEVERPWLLVCRQRLASRMFRDLSAIGQRWEERGGLERAEHVYRRGVELDAVSEVLYRRLMSVQIQRGDRAGALATYDRCRQMLSATLGVAPSAETESVHRSVMSAT